MNETTIARDDGPSDNDLAGQLAIQIIRGMPPPPDHAGKFQRAIEAALKSAGFFVRREAYVGRRESGRGEGYIDILARIHGGFVAIELDWKSPRSKSFDKLRAFNAFRMVVLRGAPPWTEERGIDAIFSIPVSPA